GERGHEARWLLRERGPLHVPEVAAALGGDPARGPRLLGGPLDDVVAVTALVTEGIPAAFALVAAAHVHVHHGVAHAREHDEPVVDADVLALHAVRRPDNDRGELSLTRRAIHVGVHRDAVAHRDGAVVVYQDALELLRGRRCDDEQQRGEREQERAGHGVLRDEVSRVRVVCLRLARQGTGPSSSSRAIRPRLSAWTIACARFSAWSFASRWPTCVFTVSSLIPSEAAISLFARPRASCRRTSTSREVSSSGSEAARTSWRPTPGSMYGL